MSEDNQWRQLGSIVNTVLLETRTKAVRQGLISRPAPRPLPARVVPPHSGIGFLRKEAPAAPPAVQLELPFGIEAGPSRAPFGTPGAPRRARLM